MSIFYQIGIVSCLIFANRAPNYCRLCFCRILQIIFFGLLRRLGYLERKQPNMSAESFCHTLFWDTEVKEKMKLNEIEICDNGYVNSQFSSSWYITSHQFYPC